MPKPIRIRIADKDRTRALAEDVLGSGESLLPEEMAGDLIAMLPNRAPFTEKLLRVPPERLGAIESSNRSTTSAMSGEVVLDKKKLTAIVPCQTSGLELMQRVAADASQPIRTKRFSFAKNESGQPDMRPCEVCGFDTSARRHGRPVHMICDPSSRTFGAVVDVIRRMQTQFDLYGEVLLEV